MNHRKRSSAELKQFAREALFGRYGVMSGAAVLLFALNMIASFLPSWVFPQTTAVGRIGQIFVSVVVSLLIGLFSAGFSRLALDVSYERQPILSNMLYPFFHHPDRFLITYLIFAVIQLICQIPLHVIDAFYAPDLGNPNIGMDVLMRYTSLLACVNLLTTLLYQIVTLGLTMATYLLLDYDSISPIEALKESWRMMRGNKWRLFYITLSFVGVILLGILTCGIGMLWVMPYMETTMAFFYRDLKNDL